MSWIVILGDVVGGFEFVGPFPEGGIAVEWAERHTTASTPWTVALLDEPDVG